MFEAGFEAFVESGPGRTLGTFVKQQPVEAKPVFVQNTRRAPNESVSDAATLLRAAGNLWQLGMPLDWSQFHAGQSRQKISLPTYPFEKLRCWIELRSRLKASSPVTTFTGRLTWRFSNGFIFQLLAVKAGAGVSAGKTLLSGSRLDQYSRGDR